MRAAGRRCPDRPATSYGPWDEMSYELSNAATFPPKRQMTEEKIIMKAIVVTDRRAASWVCAIHRDVCTGVCRTLCWRGFELVVPRQIGNGFEALSETALSGRGRVG